MKKVQTMKKLTCVLSVALGAGMAIFAAGCALDATSGDPASTDPAANEANPNAPVEVSPGGVKEQSFHKVGSQDPGGSPGNNGQSTYPWPSPWHESYGMSDPPTAQTQTNGVNESSQIEQGLQQTEGQGHTPPKGTVLRTNEGPSSGRLPGQLIVPDVP